MNFTKSAGYTTPSQLRITQAGVKTGMFLSPFTPFTFTNMSATGAAGPTAINYSPLPSGTLSLSGGIQYWTVPSTRVYNFTVAGAGNYNPNSSAALKTGYGIILTASRSLTAGTVIAILVGQMGLVGTSDSRATGGSGGTFVATVTAAGSLAGATPLFIAGGSGGIGYQGGGTTDTNGTIANNGRPGGAGGAGGTAPNGGAGGNASDGGAGYSGNGGACTFNGSTASLGISFTNGGTGGTNNYYAAAYGGFGGGGAAGQVIFSNQYPAGGGGGGYGGGGGGGSGGQGASGGGGGSYDITGVYSGSSTNTGMGYVTVTG